MIAPMSKRRSNFGVVIYNNRIHVIGGFDGRKHTKSIEVYDDDKNVWRKLKYKLPRGLAGMNIISVEPHKIMLVGGITQ
jgi:N-acetylneuraminic acid mutarotase